MRKLAADRKSRLAQVKLRPKEDDLLKKLSRARRRAGLPDWTRSAILRRAFLLWASDDNEQAGR